MSEHGIVYLVGAGPGDPGLLTLRGLECLRQADAVVYDNLANPDLLAHAPASAERIYVGKRAGAHTLDQEQINALLIERARAGRRVVRLKGGDPFVFGRGGEEALALRRAGVRVEVVPGVTAGIAAPACAGIPVTQRGLASVVSLVTGHEDPGKEESALDWEALARGGGTLVFYMGVANLPAIVDRLLRHGRPADTPAAVISRGTLPLQRVVEGTLGTIAARAAEAGVKPPAVTVVGAVAALRAELAWFEARPLFGRTVVVTRSRAQAGDLTEALARLGARVLSLPTIAIEPPADPGPLERAVASLPDMDWVVFGSTNAVEHFFAALARAGGDSRRLGPCRVAAVGPATAEALRERGIAPDLAPARAASADLAEALRRTGTLPGACILLPRSEIAPPDLPASLRAAGADVVEVVAYRTVPAPPVPEVLAALREGEADVVVFTSSSTARRYAAMVREALGGIPAGVAYASIGPETSKAAAAEGIPIAIEASEHTIPGLLEALVAQAENGRL